MVKDILILTLLLISMVQADFVRDDAKKVVNDTTTCLMWQDDIASRTVRKDWQGAIEYCENLNFIGFTDWRLPNINELSSISDRSRYIPAINNAFKVVSKIYWSSTTYVYNTDYAWVINTNYSLLYSNFKPYSNYVRCVRLSQ